jgi:uncharacterized glyoxalase superfamily protein PhnB
MTNGRDDLDALEAALVSMPSAAFKARLRARLAGLAGHTEEHAMTTSVLTTGVRPGFTTVTPYLYAQDVERLIAFAKDVFGAEETARARGSAGGVHCELRIGDSMLMVLGGMPPGPGGELPRPRNAGLHVYVPDADAVYQRALDAGAESLGAPYDAHYGERAGFVKDPAGNEWYIATHTGPSYSAEGLRTVTPNLRGPDAPAYIAFLTEGLGARIEMRAEQDGVVRHAVLRMGDAAIELGEGNATWPPIRCGLYLYVPDCDALYRQALAAGATGLEAPNDKPYGDRVGTIEDRWGNEWFLASHRGR